MFYKWADRPRISSRLEAPLEQTSVSYMVSL